MVHPGEQHQVQDALQQTVMLEVAMVDRNKYGAIREMARLGSSKKEIARQLEVTVKTVRRALKKPQWEPYQRQKPATTRGSAASRGARKGAPLSQPQGGGGDVHAIMRSEAGLGSSLSSLLSAPFGEDLD